MKGTTRAALVVVALVISACSGGDKPPVSRKAPAGSPEVMRMVTDYARYYGVPPSLMHRIVRHESSYNPSAKNGPYLGLMQIAPQTARIMGHDGPATGLLDPETNLRYGGKYLRGAWLVSHGDEERAIQWYRKGYYYEAKRMGLLEEAGLR